MHAHLKNHNPENHKVPFSCAGVPVYLAPWAACPPGVKLPLGSLPPGGEDTPGYLAPHPGQLAPRGEAASGQLAPRGCRYPGLGSLPPTPRKPDRTLFRKILLLLNKNLYDRYMEKLIFYVHMHILPDRRKLRSRI